MPITDLINTHLTAAEKTALLGLLEQIQQIIMPKSRNLTPEERQKYGSVNEYNKLLINKVRDYYQIQPSMASPDVDWVEFEADFQDRNFYEKLLTVMSTVMEMVEDTKKLHDYDVYQASLMDYDFTKYKMGTDSPGYDTKHEAIRKFFPNTGGGGKPEIKPSPE